MKVEKLSIMNLEMLYKCTAEQKESTKWRFAPFGRNFPQLLSHITFTFELSDVSDYEYIFLKMYCTHITPKFNYNDGYVDLDMVDNKYPEVKTAISSLVTYLTMSSEEIGSERYVKYLLPAGVPSSRCIVTLRGYQLEDFIHSDPHIFFTRASKGKCIMGDKKDEFDIRYNMEYKFYEDEDFTNYVIGTFIDNFYKFMVDRIRYTDILSDATNHEKYLNKGDMNDIYFISFNNPFLQYDFNSPSTELSDQLASYFEATKDSKVFTKDYLLKNTFVEITIHTSFAVFLEFFSLLPCEKFTSMESFSIPLSETIDENYIPQCPEELKSKFAKRHSGRLTNFVEAMNQNFSSDSFVVKRLELTQGYVPYHFIITISLSDIDEFFVPYLDMEKKDDYVSEVTESIINKIIKKAQTIYNVI